MAADQSLSIERFAELRAEMDAGVRRDELLAREGLSADVWTQAQRGWLEKMGADLERGRFELSTRYAAAFVARQSGMAPKAAPAPPKASSPAASLPAAASPSAASPPARPELPSFMVAQAAAQTPAAPPAAPRMPPVVRSALQGTSLDVRAPGASLPFAKGAPPAPPPPAAAGRLPPVVRSALQGTSLDVRAPAVSMPFAKGAPPAPPPPKPAEPPAKPTVAEVKAKLGGTAYVSDATPAAPSTPFAAAEVGAMGMTLKSYAELTAAIELAPARIAETLAAHGLTTESKVKLDAHWDERFTKNGMASLDYMRLVAEAKKTIKARAAAPAAPSPPAPPAPAKPAVPNAAVPNAAVAAKVPSLTLQQYASLVAEIAVDPEHADAIRVKYGVANAAVRGAFERAWAERLTKDPAARAEVDRLAKEYTSWLKRQR